MGLVDIDVKAAAKIAVDEAASTLVPALAAAIEPIVNRAIESLASEIAKLGPAIIEELDGLTITLSRKPKA